MNVSDEYIQEKYDSLKKFIEERTKIIEKCKNDILLATGQIQFLENLKTLKEEEPKE